MPASIGGYNDPQQLQAVKVAVGGNVMGTYDNGPTLNGVGATYTTQATIIIVDGYRLQLFDRIILPQQTDSTQNGVYFHSGFDPDSGFIVLQRATDFQSGSQIVPGIFGVVTAGNSNDGTIFTVNAPIPFRVGKDTVTFNFIRGTNPIVTYPLIPSLGGTGIANADANTLTLNAPTVIDSRGIITSPAIPMFLAYFAVNDPNITGDGTNVQPLIYPNTVYNIGAGYDTGTGLFTAPVTGIYNFQSALELSGLGAGHAGTSWILYVNNFAGPTIYLFAATITSLIASGFVGLVGSTTLKLTAGDTVGILLAVTGGAKTVGVFGDPNNLLTTFSGQLIA